MNWWDIYHIILMLGALQGIILGINLWRGNFPRQKANRWLAVLLFFFAYRLITEVLYSIEVIHYNTWLYHAFLDYNWIYGTLIFFYIQAYIDVDFKFQRNDWLHFLPVGTEFLLSNYVKTQNFYWDGTRESLSWLGEKAYVLWMHTPFQIIITGGLILYYVWRSKKLLTAYTTDNTKPVHSEDVNWLDLMLKIYFGFTMMIIALGLIDYGLFNYAFNPFYQFPTYITLAGLTYWLGLQGFARKNAPILTKTKQQQSYNTDELETVLIDLQQAMEIDLLYKNPTLTLAELAAHLNLKPYQLTQVLNRSLQKSFSDYVNEFRVEAVREMVNNPSLKNYTLLAIAFEAGFNSKASFNRIVKKITGKSPKFLKKAPII